MKIIKSQSSPGRKLRAHFKTAVYLMGATTLIVAFSQDAGDTIEKTFWNDRLHEAKLRKISAGIQIEIFEQELGKAYFVDSSTRFTARTFANEYFYTKVVSSTDGTVLFYSVTTRKDDFNPVVYLPAGSGLHSWVSAMQSPTYPLGETEVVQKPVQIGKTPFAELVPDRITGFTGANRYSYSESMYFGNPGNYQYFVFSINDSVAPEPPNGLWEVTNPSGSIDISGDLLSRTLSDQRLENIRGAYSPNTYSVISPDLPPDYLPEMLIVSGLSNLVLFGPDSIQVRILRDTDLD